jgi:inhibitor of cysteine peptidase
MRALVLLSLLALGCASTAKAGPLAVTQDDDKKEVRVASGREVEVHLVSSPGTGYSWQLDKVDSATLVLIGTEDKQVGEVKPGSPSETIFRFRAAAAGAAPLHFRLVRPWEKAAAPSKEFQINVVVE